MKLIPLTQGKFTQVDDEDFDWLNQWKWCCKSGNYVNRAIGNKKNVLMHRVIMNPPEGMVIDHIDGNPLNNQRANLRICTRQQNNCNTRKGRVNNTTGYKGAYYRKKVNKYLAQISIKKNRICLGFYETAIEAARAYDEAAKEAFGEYASLNDV